MYELPERGAVWAWVLVRVSFGLLWLEGASWKELPYFGLEAHENLYYWVSRAVEYPVWQPYAFFVEQVVLPNFLVFAWAIFISEVAIGLCFVFGFGTRFAALWALCMTANIALAVLATPGEWPWSYALMGMVALLFLVRQDAEPFSLERLVKKYIAHAP